MKLVFPTAASPAKTTLYVRSGGPVASSAMRAVGKCPILGFAAAEGRLTNEVLLGAGVGFCFSLIA